MFGRCLITALALSALATNALAGVWVPAWTASPTPDRRDGPDKTSLVFERQSVRQDIRLGTSAKALRFRISNELGNAPLKIDTVSAWRVDNPKAKPLQVRFDGRTELVVPVGEAVLSDPVAIAAPAFALVALNLHFPEPTRPAVRRTAVRIVDGAAIPGDREKLAYRQSVVSAVFAERDEEPVTIVALGDSITEGGTAGIGKEGDWPALLARRLASACPNRYVVLNEGISGNMLLDAGRSPSALSRLDRDVLSLPGVDYVVVLEGINDIRSGGVNSKKAARGSQDMIAGYRELASRIKAKGARVYGATLTPFGGSERYEPVSANTRQELNRFIREAGVFDAVVDFDAVLRDPARPEFLPDAITRDHLHPNAEGYAKMADSIDLSLFGCATP